MQNKKDLEYSPNPFLLTARKCNYHRILFFQKIPNGAALIAQVFAVLFALAGFLLGLPYLINAATNFSVGFLADFTATIDSTIDSLITSPVLTIAARVIFLLIGIISFIFIFIFINKGIYKKHKITLPKRLRKYEVFVRESVRKGKQRVLEMKSIDASLQTRADRKLFDYEKMTERAFKNYDGDTYF